MLSPVFELNQMNFSDLQFNPHPNYPDNGVQAKHFFNNGYGVSVVRFNGSYGYEVGLYESAVLKGTEEDFEICYDTEIADNVIGYQSKVEVEELLQQIKNL
jgi:hypothetical protein